ncbi:hypothetical protein EW145_g5079 [Phellinidium pouzarii]|uniref:C3H1-type domain-containing protein n=1 Tax=Phellinidium pouzarii TaxID=167371 RepID=A0A4S4L1B7_9AGAM|nr:hypothetical protein EW145_g5079 [Phellinidium pouzarii]
MSLSSEDTLKAEIARLTGIESVRQSHIPSHEYTGAINRHKAGPTSSAPSFSGRNNSYVNPDYKPPSDLATGPGRTIQRTFEASRPLASSSHHREVVIDGVAFRSSERSLVRKDFAKAPLKPLQPTRQDYAGSYPGSRATHRHYKSKSSRRFPQNRNMTLANGRKPISVGRKSVKSVKYIDKQCSRFSVTGICPRGRICPYKHDPCKTAICWPFLQGTCINTAENCLLSHDPTPERTPLCVHFANHGRCKNGDSCFFPHVRVGPRDGVCRDFAVLGYCEKGIDCDKQHVRECPDFAERGICPNPKCKLPHVIRASQRRAALSAAAVVPSVAITVTQSEQIYSAAESLDAPSAPSGSDAKIGDEYISLTFHESEESDDEDNEDEDDDDEDENEEADGDGECEEDDDPNDDMGSMEVHV